MEWVIVSEMIYIPSIAELVGGDINRPFSDPKPRVRATLPQPIDTDADRRGGNITLLVKEVRKPVRSIPALSTRKLSEEAVFGIITNFGGRPFARLPESEHPAAEVFDREGSPVGSHRQD